MIRKTIKGGDFKSQMVGELVFDQVPEEGSFNPVTSDAVAKIAGGVADLDAIVPEGASEENKLATASDVAGVQEDVDTIDGKIPSDTSTTNKLVNESGLQDAIDNASESWSTGFTPKGESSVSDLNDLATQSNGDSYIVTDSGTLTDGSLAVVAGDQVAWDATNSVWYKLPQYALKQFGTNAIKNLSTTITSFRTGDVIPVDGPSGTAKMSKDDLLSRAAEKAFYYDKFMDANSNIIDVKSLSLGNINITGSGWTWWAEVIASVNAVARLNEDIVLNLKEGDAISLIDFTNYKLNVGYTLDGGVTYSYTGWKNVPFICPGDGRYVFNVASNDGTTTHTIEEFANVVRVLSANSAVSLVNTENRLNKDNSLIGRNFFKKISLTGTGSTIYAYFEPIPSTKIRVYIDNPNWAVTSMSSASSSKLLIANIKSDGTTTQIKNFTRDKQIPSFFDIDIPSTEYRARIHFFADVGENVNFVLEYRPMQFENVDDDLKQLPSRKVDVRKLSLGNINITGSGWTWWDEVAGNANAIARINEDVVLNLSEGDEISLTDFVNYKLNVGYTLDGGVTYLYSGYKNQKFICPGVGRYVFDISSNDGTTTHTIYEFANVLSIKSKNINAISVFSLDEDEEKKLEYLGFGKTHNFQITGTGNSWVYHRVKVAPNSKIRVRCDKPSWACTSVTSGKVLQLASVNNGGTSYENLGFYPSTGVPSVFDHLAQSDTYYILFAVKADVGEVINFSVECVENKLSVSQGNRYIRSINHRGYNPIAPENTLPAFIMSARLGFNCVETDIQKTSDGYYVCIHDETVDRTSDGTGAVADKTLAQLKALDFGSWRNSRYAGTKIPTFDEFLDCCKKLGLHPYVELKAGFDELEKVAASVKAYGFEKDITFASYLLSALQQMKTLCPYARLGQVLTTIGEGDLANIAGLKNGTNEVFLDYYNVAMDDSVAEDCIAAGIGLELWTCDTTQEIVNANGYVSGITSNFIVAEQVLFDKEIG